MLTEKQYEFLATFESGRVYTVDYDAPNPTFDWFLHDGGLIQSNVQKEEDFYVLSPDGEKSLAEFREQREKEAIHKREKRQDRIHDLLMIVIGAVLGVLADYFFRKRF